MERDDYLEIVSKIKQELKAHGLDSIAEDENYISDPYEEGEYRLPDPQQHAILLLKAFRRHLNVNSRHTLEDAVARLRKHTNESFPSTVRVRLMARRDELEDSFESSRYINLNEVPDVSETISSLDLLLEMLSGTESGMLHE